MPATQSQHKKPHLCSQLPTQHSRRQMRNFAVAAVVPARPATFPCHSCCLGTRGGARGVFKCHGVLREVLRQ